MHMAQLMPLPLASVKSRLVLPFWYRLTRIVPDKGPLNWCMYVCMYVGLDGIFIRVRKHHHGLRCQKHPFTKAALDFLVKF